MSMLLADPGRIIPRQSFTRTIRRHRLKQIALAFPLERSHLNQVIRGIAEWSAQHDSWQFTTFPASIDTSIRMLDWDGDGVIAALSTREEIDSACKLTVPCVNISGMLADERVPRVTLDSVRIGQLAADHLLACGFRRFGYYGIEGARFSELRGEGFVQQLITERIACARYASSIRESDPIQRQGEIRRLCTWLSQLDKPTAIFAANDLRARILIDACALMKLRVPDDISVLGVDNDPLLCECAEPPLSSVVCDWWKLGYRAAETLARLMDEHEPKERTQLIQPLGVIKRRSTAPVTSTNSTVTRAIEFVRTHLSEVFGVEALLHATGVPRRSIEIAFRQSLGCTPYEMITRMRLIAAKDMLTESKRHKLTDIAAACGFADLRRFRLVFRRECGMSPAEFRQSQQAIRRN